MKLRWTIALVLLAFEHWAFWHLAYGIRHRDYSESYRWLLMFWYLLPPLTAAIVLAPWRYQIAATACNGLIAAALYRSVGFYEPPHLKDSIALIVVGLALLVLLAAAIGGFVRVIAETLMAAAEPRLSRRVWLAVRKGAKFSLICVGLAAPVALMIGPPFPGYWSRVILTVFFGVGYGFAFGVAVGFLVGLTIGSQSNENSSARMDQTQ
jgi:hypothetical protein